MPNPTITDYVNSIESHSGVFRTLGEIALSRDVYGAPEIRAGNSAAIFTYETREGEQRFLKCYIRPNPHLGAIYGYIEKHRPPLLPEVRLLPRELFVHTIGSGAGWVDIVEGAWTPGQTLARAATGAAAARNASRLGALADSFDGLWCDLLNCEWAHGDLKPENIIVGPGGLAGRMSLIDCDAMWIPELAGATAVELGTPPWRHPERGPGDFNKLIDDHPAAMISAILRLLAVSPSIWPGERAFKRAVEGIHYPRDQGELREYQ
jgi:serine/threonine protein kinase